MATNFSFSGNFFEDDDRAIFTFSVLNQGDVTLRTLSYGGALAPIDPYRGAVPYGGFDTNLTVFSGVSSNSTVLQQNDDAGNCIDVNQDPNTDGCFDSYIFLPNLAAGTYVAVLSQYGNVAGITLADSFSEEGNANYTGILTAFGPNFRFVDLNPDQRTSFWAIDFLGAVNSVTVSETAVPEPSTVFIFGAGLLAIWARSTLNRKS